MPRKHKIDTTKNLDEAHIYCIILGYLAEQPPDKCLSLMNPACMYQKGNERVEAELKEAYNAGAVQDARVFIGVLVDKYVERKNGGLPNTQSNG